jgi:hypothetical protein
VQSTGRFPAAAAAKAFMDEDLARRTRRKAIFCRPTQLTDRLKRTVGGDLIHGNVFNVTPDYEALNGCITQIVSAFIKALLS